MGRNAKNLHIYWPRKAHLYRNDLCQQEITCIRRDGVEMKAIIESKLREGAKQINT